MGKRENSGGIQEWQIRNTPIAVVDIETTGLTPDFDRIIEIGVVRIDPEEGAEVILDTLVNPGRKVSATEIHGIRDSDVRDAPRFEEVKPHLLKALEGCVFAAYNVYFDVRFVREELGIADELRFPPYLCLMYLRPLLDLGARCSLGDACKEHGLGSPPGHVAADDAMAGARLWETYLPQMDALGVRTFADLRRRKAYKFFNSFRSYPLTGDMTGEPPPVRLKSRRKNGTAISPDSPVDRPAEIGEYWAALIASIEDMEITREELRYLQRKQKELRLEEDEMRWMHARLLSGLLASASKDFLIDDREVEVLHKATNALREVGWCPGDEETRLAYRRGIRGWFNRLRSAT